MDHPTTSTATAATKNNTDAQALLTLAQGGVQQTDHRPPPPPGSLRERRLGKKSGSKPPSDLRLNAASFAPTAPDLISIASPFFLQMEKPMTPNQIDKLRNPVLLHRIRNEITKYIEETKDDDSNNTNNNPDGSIPPPPPGATLTTDGDQQLTHNAPPPSNTETANIKAAQTFWEPMNKALTSPLGQMEMTGLLTPFAFPTPGPKGVRPTIPALPVDFSRILQPPTTAMSFQNRGASLFHGRLPFGNEGYDVETATKNAEDQINNYRRVMQQSMDTVVQGGVPQNTGWSNREGLFLPNPFVTIEPAAFQAPVRDSRMGGRVRRNQLEEDDIAICKLPDGRFQCPKCSKISVRKSDHIKHQRIHSNSRPYVCTYPGCNSRFSDPSTRSRHMKAHDPGQRIECPFPGCNKAYSRQSNMQRHYKTQHFTGTEADAAIMCQTVPSPPPPSTQPPPNDR